VRKLKGADQLMALFNLFCIQGACRAAPPLRSPPACSHTQLCAQIADFINRQMADVNVRRSQHVASKAAVEEEEQVKKVTAALQCVACCCCHPP
jgi:hypothetical protein